MKKYLLLLAGIPLIVTSCTEITDPPEVVVRARDTSYTAAVEAPQQKVVLLEEFTGVKCPNCPDAHKLIATLEAANPGRLISIGYYPKDIPQAKPIMGITTDDFTTDDAKNLGNDVMGTVEFLPIGSVDRSPIEDKLLADRAKWNAALEARKAAVSPVNVTVNSDYDAETRKATVTVRAAFTQAYTGNVALSIAILEDNIIQPQLDIDVYDTFYVHKHVLRDLITPVAGAPILNSSENKAAGQVFERVFFYDIPENWKAENLRLVAFVHANTAENKSVLQAAEAHVE